MDFIDEDDVARFEAGQQPGQVAGFVDHRPRGGLDIHPHGAAQDEGQGGLAQTGGAREQDVVEGLAALPGRLHRQHQAFAHPLLADEVIEGDRAQAVVEGGITLVEGVA